MSEITNPIAQFIHWLTKAPAKAPMPKDIPPVTEIIYLTNREPSRILDT